LSFKDHLKFKKISHQMYIGSTQDRARSNL
jgi:hypothetical protein